MPSFSHCAYCHVEFDPHSSPKEQDHVIPKKRGGCECWENKVDACQECNRAKNTMTPLEYYNSLLENAFDEGGFTLQESQGFLLQSAYWEARARLHLWSGCLEREEVPYLAHFD